MNIKSVSSIVVFAALLSFFSLAPSPAFASFGLVEQLNLNEGTGTTAIDSSGLGNDGTWQGTPSGNAGTYYVPGRNGSYAGEFDGTDNYVQASDSPGLHLSSGLTMAVWFKKTANGSFDRLISKVNDTGSQFVWGLQLTNANQLQMYVGNATTSTNYNLTGNTAITDTNWHYYAATYNAASGTASLYVDGVLDKTGQLMSGTPWSGDLATSSGPLLVGKFIYGSTSYYTNGAISDVQIYNQALSSTQIYSTYDPTPVPGVAADYELTVGGNLAIIPDCSDLSGTVTYTSSDQTFWNASSHTWSFTPIFEDGGTIKNLTFSCTNGTINRVATTTVVTFRDFSTLVRYPGNPIIPADTANWNTNGTDALYLHPDQNINGTWYSVTEGDAGSSSWCDFNLYTSNDLKTWTPYANNPVLTCSPTVGAWDHTYLEHPGIIKISDVYYMYYSAGQTTSSVGIATSSDMIHWTKYVGNPVYNGNPAGTDKSTLSDIIKIGSLYYLYYWNMASSGVNVEEYATSPDGYNWTYGGVALPRLSGNWDYSVENTGCVPFVIQNSNGFYEQVYATHDGSDPHPEHVGYAISADGIHWYEYQAVPILSGTGVNGDWDEAYTADPVLVPYENYMYLYYAGVNASTTAQGGLAWIESSTTGMYVGVTNVSYADGSMSYASTSPNGMTAVPLTVAPSAGSVAVSIGAWNTGGSFAKQWTAEDSASTTVVYDIGNLANSTNYTVSVDGVAATTTQSDDMGQISYAYAGDVASHVFSIAATVPTVSSVTASVVQTTPAIFASSFGGSVSGAELASLLAPSTTTTAYLNSLNGQSSLPGCPIDLVCAPATNPTAGTTTSGIAIPITRFARNLEVGDTGNDVRALQNYLNEHGYVLAASGPGSPGDETDMFGNLTKAAVEKFQRYNGLPATGFFGPLTRNLING